MLDRRGFLRGLIAAPAVIRSPGLLMPIKPVPLIFTSQPLFIEHIVPDYKWNVLGDHQAFHAFGEHIARDIYQAMRLPSSFLATERSGLF